MRNPYLFWLLTVFSLVNIADVVTAFFILPAEANPIYLLTGSYIVLFIPKLLLVIIPWWFYYHNTFPNNITYYGLILVITLGTMMMGIGAYSNVSAMFQPEAVAAAANIPASVKIAEYGRIVTLIYILPMLFSMMAFWIYDKSSRYVMIKSEPIRWWKRWSNSTGKN